MGPKLDEQVCYALYSTSATVTKAYRGLLKSLNLTYPQFVVMMALWQKDGVSMTVLANIVGNSKATMTPLLKRLETLGYITRELAENDERQKNVLLTNKGRNIAPNAALVAKHALCATGLTMDEAEQLMSLCQKVKTQLA